MTGPASQATVIVVGRRHAADEAAARKLGEILDALFEWSGSAIVVCDVSDLPPEAAAIELLARLQLAARRRGGALHLRHASSELLELLAFTGLRDVLLPQPG